MHPMHQNTITVQTGPSRSINFDNDYNHSQIEMIPAMHEKVERACKVYKCIYNKKTFFLVFEIDLPHVPTLLRELIIALRE